MNICKDSLSGIGGEKRPGIVHRLDKDTSGLLIVAKNDKAHLKMSEQIKDRKVNKKYIALVRGIIKENEATINMPIARNKKDRKKMAVDKDGKEAIGKPKGSYITIDIKDLKHARDEDIQKFSETLTAELKKIIEKHVDNKAEILVVGLGNIYVTPDSLGPKVINEIDVTRHLLKYMPQYLDENKEM